METGDSERLQRLEREVTELRQEVARLQERVGSTGPERPAPARTAPAPVASVAPTSNAPAPVTPAPPPPSPVLERRPAPRHAPLPARLGRSLEELVGRYGTIGVATITLLVGVGVFLNWAIQHGLLGPTTRVVLGYLAAAAVAGVGLRLRRRGTRSFGNVLLAMALCVVHLVCWSAGPLLHVLPSVVALAVALLASAVLARFALRHEEELLCALGFGGAALAPFLTSDRSGNVIALAVYGVIVLALSGAALGDRAWRTARGVTLASVLAYLLAVSRVRPESSAWPWILARIEVLFALALLVALLPLARGRQRGPLLRMASLALILGGLLRPWTSTDPWTLVFTTVAAVLAVGALDRLRPPAEGEPILDAFVLPIGFFVAALMAVETFLSGTTAVLAGGWALLAGFMSHRRREGHESESFAAAATLTALLVAPAALSGHERSTALGQALVGLGLGFAMRRLPRSAFALGALAGIGMASVRAVTLLAERPTFGYAPFLTPESAVALALVVAWLLLWRCRWEPRPSALVDAKTCAVLKQAPTLGAALIAFLWVREELAGAWSLTASTALLVVYYATTGTVGIWLGRRHGPKALRVVGLWLTLWAAGKTLREATDVASIALRVGLYFAVSAFLIAVAYWYRAERTTSAGGEPAS